MGYRRGIGHGSSRDLYLSGDKARPVEEACCQVAPPERFGFRLSQSRRCRASAFGPNGPAEQLGHNSFGKRLRRLMRDVSGKYLGTPNLELRGLKIIDHSPRCNSSAAQTQEAHLETAHANPSPIAIVTAIVVGSVKSIPERSGNKLDRSTPLDKSGTAVEPLPDPEIAADSESDGESPVADAMV